MARHRAHVFGVAGAAAVLLAGAAVPAQSAIVAPPEPAEVERLFREACWRGLRDQAIFRRALEASPLDFERSESGEPGEHYGGRASEVHYRRGTGCTIRAHLRSLDEAEDIVRRISGFVALQPHASVDPSDSTRTYRSAPLPAGGGSVFVELAFTPPVPQRIRMYPPPFILAISVYFTPDQ